MQPLVLLPNLNCEPRGLGYVASFVEYGWSLREGGILDKLSDSVEMTELSVVISALEQFTTNCNELLSRTVQSFAGN